MITNFSQFRDREGKKIYITHKELGQAAEKLLTAIEMQLKQFFEEGITDLTNKMLVVHGLGHDLMFSLPQEQIRRFSFIRDAYGIKKRHTDHIHGEDFIIEDAS